MSIESQQPQTSQVPVEVCNFANSILSKVKNLKNTPLRPFFEQAVTFLSIIGAYYFVSLSFENEELMRQLTGFQFTNKRTQTTILLVYALYLIGLKLLRSIMYRYETTPPKKPVPENWEEAQQQTKKQQQHSHEHEIKPLTADSYTVMIDQLINYSVYGLVFTLCTTSYTFFNLFNKSTFYFIKKENKLVEVQQINYLMLWFVGACIFYSSGKILGKLVKISTFHHFGLTIGILVVIIEIGLSHGFNMFVFI